jgi:hypothetical protein
MDIRLAWTPVRSIASGCAPGMTAVDRSNGADPGGEHLVVVSVELDASPVVEGAAGDFYKPPPCRWLGQHEQPTAYWRTRAAQSFSLNRHGGESPSIHTSDAGTLWCPRNTQFETHGLGICSTSVADLRRLDNHRCDLQVFPAAIDSHGDKVKVRHIAARASTPLVHGTADPVSNADEIVAFAKEHGLPVAIKAAFGGGGRKVVTSRRRAKTTKTTPPVAGELAIGLHKVAL